VGWSDATGTGSPAPAVINPNLPNLKPIQPFYSSDTWPSRESRRASRALFDKLLQQSSLYILGLVPQSIPCGPSYGTCTPQRSIMSLIMPPWRCRFIVLMILMQCASYYEGYRVTQASCSEVSVRRISHLSNHIQDPGHHFDIHLSTRKHQQQPIKEGPGGVENIANILSNMVVFRLTWCMVNFTNAPYVAKATWV
jgi:hypothetical protein